MNNKILCIVLAAILAAIVAGLILFKIMNNTEIPAIEPNIQNSEIINTVGQKNVEEQNVVTPITEDSESVVKEQKSIHKVLPKKPVTEKPKIKIIQVEEAIQSKENDTQESLSQIRTEEEEDILKKVPASNIVVIDKEIKIKSRERYVFK